MHDFSTIVKEFEQRLEGESVFPQGPENLYEPCRYFLSMGAKRVRPALCVMGNEMFGDINPDTWHAAAAVELFHNFTLIHDDIMDKAPLRRGNVTVHAKYGLTTGILSGDIMGIYAYDRLARISTRLPDVLRLFNRTAIEVCEGQQLDMDFESRNDVTIDEYIHMIALKTSVLVACSLKMGAMIGGASNENADKIYEFGKNVGIAFQLQDDYLDAYGDTAKLGKQNGGDIKANKKTYLLLKTLELASTEQASTVHTLLQAETDTKVAHMLEVFNETAADKACREAVEYYSALAFQNLADIDVEESRKQHLHALASWLLQRDK